MMKYLNNEGFSILELLVSVAIIGLIAAIAIPEYKQYKGKIYNAVAQSDARNLRAAIEASIADYETAEGLVAATSTAGFTITRAQNGAWSDATIKDIVLGGASLSSDDIVARIITGISGGIQVEVAHCKGALTSSIAIGVTEICLGASCFDIPALVNLKSPPIYNHLAETGTLPVLVHTPVNITELCDTTFESSPF